VGGWNIEGEDRGLRGKEERRKERNYKLIIIAYFSGINSLASNISL
jgi:hypothetical protein